MKECVYGWYPPARDLWKTSREGDVDSYTKECLYKHRESRFSTTKEDYRSEGSPNPNLRSHLNCFTASPPCDSVLEVRSPAGAVMESRPPSGAANPGVIGSEITSENRVPHRLARSRQAWASKLAGTVITAPPAPTLTKTEGVTFTEDAGFQRRDSVRMTRSQSAATLRPRAPVTSRSVKSARPNPRPLGIPSCAADPRPISKETDAPAVEKKDANQTRRPSAPTPTVAAASVETVMRGKTLGVDNPLDYEAQLKKHGWRMEIPGDPLNLKRPCIAKRLPTGITLPIPRIPPNPPRAHIDSNDTYFYNTIPRIPMSFTIHQDWASEILNAKRIERQKMDGDKYIYRTTNFSFVY